MLSNIVRLWAALFEMKAIILIKQLNLLFFKKLRPGWLRITFTKDLQLNLLNFDAFLGANKGTLNPIVKSQFRG